MELIRYWQIVYRRWWLVVALVGIVGGVSALTHKPAPETFGATFRVNVGMEPVPPPNAEYRYSPLDVWQSSEYLMDDLAAAVRGAEFARRVAARLDDLSFSGRFGAQTQHRELTVTTAWGDGDELARIANAAVAVLMEEGSELVGSLGSSHSVLRLIDPPVVVPGGRSLKDKLDLPIRLGLALMVSVAGAFLFDYLDTSVRDAEEIEAAGIPVLGRIQRHR